MSLLWRIATNRALCAIKDTFDFIRSTIRKCGNFAYGWVSTNVFICRAISRSRSNIISHNFANSHPISQFKRLGLHENMNLHAEIHKIQSIFGAIQFLPIQFKLNERKRCKWKKGLWLFHNLSKLFQHILNYETLIKDNKAFSITKHGLQHEQFWQLKINFCWTSCTQLVFPWL